MTDSVSLKSTVTGLISFNLINFRANKAARLSHRSLIGSLFFVTHSLVSLSIPDSKHSSHVSRIEIYS